MMSTELAKACRAVAEQDWMTFDEEPDGTVRQWAEVDFVPSQRYEHKHSRPLRYVGLRILKPQGSLFADGSDRHYHAVVSIWIGMQRGCWSGTGRRPARSSTCMTN